MKVKARKAVTAYGILKTIKVADLSTEARMAVWKDIKALRPVAEEYQKERDEVLATLHDGKFDEMQSRVKAAQEREARVNKGEYTMTPEDIKGVQEINQWFAAYNGNAEAYFSEMDNREQDLDIHLVKEDELLKALSTGSSSFADMEELNWLTE